MKSFSEYLKEYKVNQSISKNKLTPEKSPRYVLWRMAFENPKKYDLKNHGKYKHYEFFSKGFKDIREFVAIDTKKEGTSGLQISLNAFRGDFSSIVKASFSKSEIKKFWYIENLIAFQENTLKAPEFYAHFITKERMGFLTGEQSPGAFSVWEKLGKVPGVKIYAAFNEAFLLPSLKITQDVIDKSTVHKFQKQREISKLAKDKGVSVNSILKNVILAAERG